MKLTDSSGSEPFSGPEAWQKLLLRQHQEYYEAPPSNHLSVAVAC